MKKFWQKIGAFKKRIYRNLDDCLALSGAVTVSYGAYLIYIPLGWIVAGIFLIAAGVLWSKGMAGEIHDTE